MILFIIITWRYHNHPGKTPQGGLSCVMAILCCLSFPELGLGTILFCGSGFVFSWLVTFCLKCSNIIRVFHKIMIAIRIVNRNWKIFGQFPQLCFLFLPSLFLAIIIRQLVPTALWFILARKRRGKNMKLFLVFTTIPTWGLLPLLSGRRSQQRENTKGRKRSPM